MAAPRRRPAARPAVKRAAKTTPPTLSPLPAFIEPMLAKPAQPFDDSQYLFEPKWDGTRAMAFVDGGGKFRVLNRRRREIGWRYPELSFLADLAPGTVLDGEMVCLGR